MGFLSIDIGYKHMACAFTEDFDSFKIYVFTVDMQVPFEQRIQQFRQNFDKIIELIKKENIQKVIIEQQVKDATNNLSIQYALGMYFSINNINFTLQNAAVKYGRFKGINDPKNYKNEGVKTISQMLDKIEICYQNQPQREIKNHRWYSEDMRQWLLKNQIDKFDDIADTVLILKAFK